MIMFHLLKYLKFHDFSNLKLVCKDADNNCETNIIQDKSVKKEI